MTPQPGGTSERGHEFTRAIPCKQPARETKRRELERRYPFRYKSVDSLRQTSPAYFAHFVGNRRGAPSPPPPPPRSFHPVIFIRGDKLAVDLESEYARSKQSSLSSSDFSRQRLPATRAHTDRWIAQSQQWMSNRADLQLGRT